MAATPRMPGRVNDRRLYILAAILTPLIVLAGFGRTYYLKPFNRCDCCWQEQTSG